MPWCTCHNSVELKGSDYKVWCSEFITDRVRSTRGGNIFSLFVCSHPGGGGTYLPKSGWGGGVPTFRVGGVPTFSGLGGGGYLPSRWGGTPVGGTPGNLSPPTRAA